MPKINQYLIRENYKKVEEVREIKNEIPSFEEFMKNYQEGNLNYDDLNGGGVDEVKGYGPMPRSSCPGMEQNIYRMVLGYHLNQAAKERGEQEREFEEKIRRLEASLTRVESELREVKVKYKHGELSNYRLREIIREKEEKIRELERENRNISQESEERWRTIGKLEAMIEELKELL